MGLFKPRAPKAPEGAAYQFHFPGDNRNPDGTYKQPSSALEINAALGRVALEIAKLRAAVGNGATVRPLHILERDIERARSVKAASAKELELKRRQFAGGVADMAAVTEAGRLDDRNSRDVTALLAEVQKRNATDAAGAELARILEVLR